MPATFSRTTQSRGVNRRGTAPEQAEATIATVAIRAKKHCRNPNEALIALHILSNHGSGALEHWIPEVIRLRN